MPVSFLSPAQRDSYGQYLGTMSRQLGIDTTTDLTGYRDGKWRFAHAAQIRTEHGYRDLADRTAGFGLTRWLYAQCWTGTERPSALFDRATTWMLAHKVLLPGATTLERFVAKLRHRVDVRVWRVLASGISPPQQRRLEDLLRVPDEGRSSSLVTLRTGAEALGTLSTLVRPPDDVFYTELQTRYRRVRLFLPTLLHQVHFEAAPAGAAVVAALEYLKRREAPARAQDVAPSAVVTTAWRRYVYGANDAVDHRAYTFCVLDQLREALRRRDVFVTPSWRYADPRRNLLAGAEWEARISSSSAASVRSLSLETSAGEAHRMPQSTAQSAHLARERVRGDGNAASMLRVFPRRCAAEGARERSPWPRRSGRPRRTRPLPRGAAEPRTAAAWDSPSSSPPAGPPPMLSSSPAAGRTPAWWNATPLRSPPATPVSRYMR